MCVCVCACACARARVHGKSQSKHSLASSLPLRRLEISSAIASLQAARRKLEIGLCCLTEKEGSKGLVHRLTSFKQLYRTETHSATQQCMSVFFPRPFFRPKKREKTGVRLRHCLADTVLTLLPYLGSLMLSFGAGVVGYVRLITVWVGGRERLKIKVQREGRKKIVSAKS